MTARVGERRRSREYALQLLFQLDLAPERVEDVLEEFWEGKTVAESVRAFAEDLVRGTMAWRQAIDEMLASCALNWRIGRMAVVDRNILRMAVFELLLQPQTPAAVVIDEAIEIAKKFGNEDSGPFINGILDSARMKLERGEFSLPAAPKDLKERTSA